MSEEQFTHRLADLLRRKIFNFIGDAGEQGEMPSDLTLTRFARRIGVNRATMSRIMNKRNGPSYATLRRMVHSPDVGSEALAALGILPDDPRIVRLLDQVIQGELTIEQLEAAIERSKKIMPGEGERAALAEADPR
jgi:transcriptional regulator with XRE-family HTH domain